MFFFYFEIHGSVLPKNRPKIFILKYYTYKLVLKKEGMRNCPVIHIQNKGFTTKKGRLRSIIVTNV